MFGIKKNKIAAAFVSSAIIFSNHHVINTNSLGLGAKIINIKNKMPTWGKVLLGTSLVLVPVGIGAGCWYYFTNKNTQDKNPENPEVPSRIDDKESKDTDNNEKEIIYSQNLEKAKKIFGDKFNLFNNLLEKSWEDSKKSLKSFGKNGITMVGNNPNSKNISFYNNEPKILWQLKDWFKNNQINIENFNKNSFKIQNLKNKNEFINISINKKNVSVSTKFFGNSEELKFKFNSKL